MGNRDASDGNSEDGTTGRDSEGSAGRDADGDDSNADGTDERLWLVERTYTDKGLVSLVYATTDGRYAVQRQRSMNRLQQGADVTAAITADAGSVAPVDDEGTREQYADEAGRMADRHDPDDAV